MERKNTDVPEEQLVTEAGEVEAAEAEEVAAMAEAAEAAGTAQTSDPGCVFCQIVDGELPAYRVYEDGAAVAFLDRRPLFHGHTLVVARSHVATLTDLSEGSVGAYFAALRHVTGAVERGMEAVGSFVAANNRVSQSVPHLHFHVVPRNHKDGLRGFFWPRHTYEDETEARRVAARIRSAL